MRADIDRVEIEREREQHHGVHRAGRIGDHYLADRQSQYADQCGREYRRDRHRHGERAEGGADKIRHQPQRRTGEARPGDRAKRDHHRVGHPPRHHHMNVSAAVQRRRSEHGAEQQAAGKPDAMGDKRDDSRGGDQNREFIELRGIERSADAAAGMADEAEQRQPGRQADRDDHHAHGLHDGDRAHVGVEFGGEPHHLRQSAGRRGKVGGNLVPAVHHAQIRGAADADADHGHDQHGDAQRIGRHAVQRRRRDHGAERNADQHQENAHRQHRDQHRPPGQRGGGDRQDRAREIAGGNSEQPQREPASGRKRQRFRDVADDRSAVAG